MAVIDDLRLKTKIKIDDKELDFELCGIENGLIKAIKLNNDVFVLDNSIKQSNETIVEEEKKKVGRPKKEITNSNESRKTLLSKDEKAPNNTALFLNWLDKWTGAYFYIG